MSNLPPTQQRSGPPAANSPRRDFEATLAASIPKLAEVIPAAMKGVLTPERITRLAMMLYRKDDNLARCSTTSILTSLMTATQVGLEPNSPLGHCYLVPYKGECTLQIGYKGFIELAHRTRRYKAIDSRLVYEADQFAIRYEAIPPFAHSPHLGDDRGRILGSYAFAYIDDSRIPSFEYMPLRDLLAIRDAAPSKSSPAWRNFEGEMFRKIVIKRLLKKSPMSVELADAIAHDHVEYDIPSLGANARLSGPRRGNASVLAQIEADETPVTSTSDLSDEDLDDLASTEGGRDG
jgi:recombination protein RecT